MTTFLVGFWFWVFNKGVNLAQARSGHLKCGAHVLGADGGPQLLALDDARDLREQLARRLQPDLRF